MHRPQSFCRDKISQNLSFPKAIIWICFFDFCTQKTADFWWNIYHYECQNDWCKMSFVLIKETLPKTRTEWRFLGKLSDKSPLLYSTKDKHLSCAKGYREVIVRVNVINLCSEANFEILVVQRFVYHLHFVFFCVYAGLYRLWMWLSLDHMDIYTRNSNPHSLNI